MIVLLTNDDGIYAEGIQMLGEALQQDEEIELYIVAPNHERSATGHAITMHRPLRAEETRFFHNSSLKGWAVNGTPSDSVKLAIEYLLPKRPDLVVSGINRGANIGTDVLYSGTVSAAIEGVILGIPAIAASLVIPPEQGRPPDFRFAANFVLRTLRCICEYDLPKDTLLNINVPDKARNEIAGVKVTRLGLRHYHNTFQKRIDPRGKSYYWLAGEPVDFSDREEEKDTDVAAIRNSYVSITPIQFDLTNYQLLDQLKEIKWEI